MQKPYSDSLGNHTDSSCVYDFHIRTILQNCTVTAARPPAASFDIAGQRQENRHLEDCHMNPNNPSRTRRPAGINKNPPDARMPRAIRFSESEWQQVRSAASKRGISFGSFVREAAMTHASTENLTQAAPIPSGVEALIRHTFRYVVVMSTLKRNEYINDGHRNDLERAIDFARQAEAELISPASPPE